MLGRLLAPGRPTNLDNRGQGPTALTVGAGGRCLDIVFLVYHFSLLSPSLWKTARYRLKYCFIGPLNPKPTDQPTNQINSVCLLGCSSPGAQHLALVDGLKRVGNMCGRLISTFGSYTVYSILLYSLLHTIFYSTQLYSTLLYSIRCIFFYYNQGHLFDY